MTDAPGGWELSRSIDLLRKQQTEGFASVTQRLDKIDDRYVTRREHDDLAKDVDEIKARESENARWRRTASFTLALAAIGWLVTIGLFIAAVIVP